MNERKNIFDTIAFWVLVATVFLMPVFFLSPTLIGFGASKLVVFTLGVFLALICFLIERMRQGSISLPWRAWYLLLALIPITYLISSFTGVLWYKSLIGGIFEQDTFHTITLCFIFAFLISSLANSTKKFWILILSLSASILIAALFQIATLMIGPSLSLGALSSKATTLAGTWNDLTALMVLLLGFVLIALETTSQKSWIKVCLTALLVFPFFFVALSTGNFNFDLWFFRFNLPILIGLISLLIFAYIFSVARDKKADVAEGAKGTGRTISRPALLVLVLAVLVVIFGGSIQGPLSRSTGVLYISGQPNWQPTYKVASEVLKTSPFFGSGPNSFAHEWNLRKPVEFNQVPFWNANFAFGVGIIPTSAVTVGLIGLLLWLAFYGFVIARASVLLFRDDRTGLSPVKMTVAYGVLFSTFIMFFATPGLVFQIAHFLMLGLLFALDTAGKNRRAFTFDKKQWHHFAFIIVSIVLAVAILFWGYVVVRKVAAMYFTNQAITKSKNEDEALGYMAKTLSLDQTQPIYGQLVAEMYASKVSKMTSLSASEIAERKEELQGSINASVSASVAAEKMDPTDFGAAIVTGRLLEYFGSLGVTGAYDQAIAKYEAASLLSPTNPLPFIFSSNIALVRKDTKGAESYLVKAISLKNNYADSPALAQGIADIIATINKGSSVPAVIAPVATSTNETADDADADDDTEEEDN